ncbi:hypothetical protein, partial [Escherichia coli]|uniref:hypothetical protein n=1 Tax=Escherichia coli TaxID=562 RepID=UPI0022F05984
PWKALHYAATSAFEAVEKLDREPGHDEGLVRWAWEQIAQAWGALEQSLDADAAAYYAATGEDAEDGSTFRRNDDSISEFLAFGREHGWDPEHL